MATLLNTSTETAPQFINHPVFQEDERAVLTLDVNGLIRSCNKAAARLMECPISLLVWQHVSNILPQLADVQLILDGHINPRLRFLSRVGHRFELAMPGGRYMSSRIFFNELESSGRHNVRLIICLDDEYEPHPG
jgi:hypothetical protein